MNILQLSGSLPRDPQFREFVRVSLAALMDSEIGEVTVDHAADFIRIVCEVESRRELGYSIQAEQRFHKFIRWPYLAWRDQQH